jgi:undecaprenyl-diphosphatase
MAEFFFSLDTAVFYFFNIVIANTVLDIIMPVLTDYDKTATGRIIVGGIIMLLLWKGGKRGRTIVILLIPMILLSDQISSSVIKKLVERARPCHEIDGVRVIQNLRLLVDCGSGYSFPSSHAVNNFAVATLFSYFYRKWTWAFMLFAASIGISRMYVGVHFPVDVFGGAVVGAVCAVIIIVLWRSLVKKIPGLEIEQHQTAENVARQ